MKLLFALFDPQRNPTDILGSTRLSDLLHRGIDELDIDQAREEVHPLVRETGFFRDFPDKYQPQTQFLSEKLEIKERQEFPPR